MDNQTVSTIKMGNLIDDLVGFLKAVLASWKMALLLMCMGSLLSLAYYFWQQPKYEGTASFILEEKGSSMGGSLSGLASQFGVDIGSLTGSAGLFAGDNILDILRSRTIIEKVLLSTVDNTPKGKTITLADLYIASSGLKNKWSGNAQLANISFEKYAAVTSNSTTSATIGLHASNVRIYDSVLLVIYQKLTKKHITVERLNKKGSIIQVATVSKDEVFSKLFTERLVMETMKMYVDIKTGTAAKNIQRLEQRADSLLGILNAKSFKSASLQVLDANIAYKSSAVPVEVTQREKTVSYALYTEVIKNLEASRMALAGQTPVINLLDNAKYPLEDQKKSIWLLLAMGILGGLAISIIVVFVSYHPKPATIN